MDQECSGYREERREDERGRKGWRKERESERHGKNGQDMERTEELRRGKRGGGRGRGPRGSKASGFDKTRMQTHYIHTALHTHTHTHQTTPPSTHGSRQDLM